MSRQLLARARALMLSTAICLPLLSCGGGGGSNLDGTTTTTTTTTTTGTTTASNVVTVTADGGPSTLSSPDVNTLFTSVTVCVPGTSTCQTIDHIEIDTGSYGLRILSSALTLTLPAQKASNGDALVECTQFVDGYSWGPVALADVKLSGETAGSVPVQVIGTSTYTSVPATCSEPVNNEEDTVEQFRANGVLGVGSFNQDCGAGCVSSASNPYYYACSSATTCASIATPLTAQVTDPVTLFDTDNNGVVITLPSVGADGSASVEGTMTFGIDTQANNASGSQTVITVDASDGDFTTLFNGQSYASFLDTGSNGLFFADSSIQQCASSNVSDFYCPPSTLALSATLSGMNSTSATVTFSVANTETLASNDASMVAFSNLAGPYPGTPAKFDWGLPFYFGRTVYTAFENVKTTVGTGPYVAF